jgi:hypothetical protein
LRSNRAAPRRSGFGLQSSIAVPDGTECERLRESRGQVDAPPSSRRNRPEQPARECVRTAQTYAEAHRAGQPSVRRPVAHRAPASAGARPATSAVDRGSRVPDIRAGGLRNARPSAYLRDRLTGQQREGSKLAASPRTPDARRSDRSPCSYQLAAGCRREARLRQASVCHLDAGRWRPRLRPQSN